MKFLSVAFVFLFILSGCGSMKNQLEQERRDAENAEARFNLSRVDAEVVRCKSKEECNKMFRIASDVVTEFSDMKIQTATENYIATFNPTRLGMIGMTARRTLALSEGEEIKLSISCNRQYYASIAYCFNKSADIYDIYKKRLEIHFLSKTP